MVIIVTMLMFYSLDPSFPSPGEVTFFTGDHKTSAFMMWHYQEPRLVTKVQVLPIPLGILSQEDSPTDLKVSR